jgi:exo-1,4-beta-D-glucosaminidase
MSMKQDAWADMTALNTMPRAAIEISARQTLVSGARHVAVRIANPSGHVAFFGRATISVARDGDEILPIQYDDNYVTVFPGETAEIHAVLPLGERAGWVRVEGYNTSATAVRID